MAPVSGVIDHLQGLTVRLGDLRGEGVRWDVRPDAASLDAMAKALGLVAVPAFQAAVTVTPWLDGGSLHAEWTAEVVQTCGVSLEDFATPLADAFTVHVLPAGSVNAHPDAEQVELDPDAPDPPDIAEDGIIDVGGYLIEHLGLGLDPFPRKPGAVFEPPEPRTVISPFAALKDLKS